MALTADTLVRCNVPRDNAERYLPLLTAGMREFDITNQRRASFFIAQLMQESMSFQFFEEIASGREYEGRSDLGNVHPGDGVRYKGRGPIQLTGRANYRFYGHKLGIDLEGHPKLAALPRVGFRTAAMYFQQRRCNEMADRGDFIGVTRAINGGTTHLAERQQFLAKLKGRDCTPGKAGITKGDKGDAVEAMTRRLSYIHDPKSNKPYLDGKRRKFDREAEIALKRFQRDHDMKPTGIFDERSQNELARRVAARKERMRAKAKAPKPAAAAQPVAQPAGQPAPAAHPGKPHKPGKRPQKQPAAAGKPAPKQRSTTELLAELERVDARRLRLLTKLLRRGTRLEALATAGAPRPKIDGGGAHLEGLDLHALSEELGRLEPLVEAVRAALHEAEHAPGAATPNGPTPITTGQP